MRKLWIMAIAGLAAAGFAVPAGQAAVVKANYTVQQDQPVKKKLVAQKKLVLQKKQTRVCENFFQCLFGGSRRTSGGSSFGGTSFSGGISDRVTRSTIAFDDAKYRPGTIIIRTPERALYYVLPGGKALRYKVGVGREGFQWGGHSRIVMKREWPDWRPPKIMIEREAAKGHIIPEYMEGGPENPLGARAMYIGGTMFRIHGTNNAASIGGAVSSGCIRMMNADVMDLYERVAIGSPVYVYQ
jgi:lipoprotein-anchoring transpeptidase ErfK/SrfK